MIKKNRPKLITEKDKDFIIPAKGSLGLLALGYVGTMLWREKIQTKKNKKNG